MLKSRIIPCLLISNGALIKTREFKDPKYVGDPLNAVRIFNEKHADELVVLDIDVSRKNLKPNFDLISKIANESSMPLCYGGGIKTIDDIEKIIHLGVEKVSISSAGIKDTSILKDAINQFGSQSVVFCMDVKKTGLIKKNYSIFTFNGKKRSNRNLLDFFDELRDLGVGEIIVNSIDKDGTLSGYDFDLIDLLYKKSNIPLTILGGASSFEDFKKLRKRYNLIGISGGSIFVFKGKYRAVLIQYPNQNQKNYILK